MGGVILHVEGGILHVGGVIFYNTNNLKIFLTSWSSSGNVWEGLYCLWEELYCI